MEIGKPEETIYVMPDEEPVPSRAPAPERVAEPVEEPARRGD